MAASRQTDPRRRRLQLIAVIGFGSLIWNLASGGKALNLPSRWHKDGPLLRVEYSRVSSDHRLTLVIVRDAEPQQTLWAYSGYGTVEDARENLRVREGRGVLTEEIGAWTAGSHQGGDEDAQAVSRWARAKRLDGVVWTRLPPKDADGHSTRMLEARSRQYLSRLMGKDRTLAEEYIRKTPGQINTEVRKLARERLEWTDYPLPIDLFAE